MTRPRTRIALLALLVLIPAAAPAGKKDDRLSKKEAAALLERAQARLVYDPDAFQPFFVEGTVELLFQDGLPAGRFAEGRLEPTRWRRELVMPGWHAGEIGGSGDCWKWSADGHLADMAPVADVVSRALNPSGFFGAASVKGKARRLPGSKPPAIEIPLSYGMARVEADTAALLSWEHAGTRFEFDGWHSAGAKTWPAGVLVTREGSSLVQVTLGKPALGAKAVPADLLTPPEGATPFYSERTPGIVPPRLISDSLPAWDPRIPRAFGTVIVRAQIGTDGRVGRVDLLKGVDPHLDGAALQAVRQRVYEPARLGERPVAILSTIRITFQKQ
jgi:TonB family protein